MQNRIRDNRIDFYDLKNIHTSNFFIIIEKFLKLNLKLRYYQRKC